MLWTRKKLKVQSGQLKAWRKAGKISKKEFTLFKGFGKKISRKMGKHKSIKFGI